MDFKQTLLEETTPQWYQRHCEFVLQDKKQFKRLMNFFYDVEQNYRLNQRATLIILEVEQVKPSWVKAQIKPMCKQLKRALPVAHKRNLLRILQHHEIPESCWGQVAEECFFFLAASEEPIAVKVFSMTVLLGLTRKIPELAPELRYLIEEQFPYGSAGFKSRGRKVLAALTRAGH